MFLKKTVLLCQTQLTCLLWFWGTQVD